MIACIHCTPILDFSIYFNECINWVCVTGWAAGKPSSPRAPSAPSGAPDTKWWGILGWLHAGGKAHCGTVAEVGPAWILFYIYCLHFQQMAAYSPVSTRSTARRRDSMSSSGGASSVRRLIAVVRSTPSRLGPVYSRRVLLRNFAALCLGHATVTAALLPLLALYAAVSANMGSLLLAALHALASLSSLVAPTLVQRVGCNWTLILGYAHACVFFGLHLYPTPYTLVPAYLALGVWMGPIVSARVTFLMTLASKLSYVVTEEDEVEDMDKSSSRRETTVRRLARGLQTAQDIGLVLGNGVTAFLLWYTQQGGCLTACVAQAS